jgi:hypothetical protein
MDGREATWIERKLQSDPNLPVPAMPKNYVWDKQDQQVGCVCENTALAQTTRNETP